MQQMKRRFLLVENKLHDVVCEGSHTEGIRVSKNGQGGF